MLFLGELPLRGAAAQLREGEGSFWGSCRCAGLQGGACFWGSSRCAGLLHAQLIREGEGSFWGSSRCAELLN